MSHHFFTVDRRQQITHEEQIIGLTQHNDINWQPNDSLELLYNDNPERELQKHVNFLFPCGVSDHGNTYFLKPSVSPNFMTAANQLLSTSTSLEYAQLKHISDYFNDCNMGIIEILFEYIRRAEFSDRPSRFTSFFAWENLEQAKKFRETHGNETMNIWKLEAKTFFRADMSLLTLGTSSILTLSYFAHRYWSGLPNLQDSDTLWEFLLPLPIKALHIVES